MSILIFDCLLNFYKTGALVETDLDLFKALRFLVCYLLSYMTMVTLLIF